VPMALGALPEGAAADDGGEAEGEVLEVC